MDVLEAIETRRSIGKVKPDPVPQELIERVLAAATWAPNHHHTEPWRFFVLTGEGRRPLGRLLAELERAKLSDPDSQQSQALLASQEAKPFRAPVVIAVGVVPSADPRVEKVEEMAAVSAAVQNMLLAAHALGLGAIWRTGSATYQSEMKRLFSLTERDELAGFVYLGFPDMEIKEGRRSPFQEKTVWLKQEPWGLPRR